MAAEEVAIVSIDYAVADIQSAVGFMYARAYTNEFKRRGMKNEAVAIVTQIKVDPQDPAMLDLKKPIGQYYDQKTAEKKAA
mgnify:CR=1 FL=1|jgi:carbamate kinase